MKKKNLILAASVLAFAVLCSFKATSTSSDVLVGKTVQVKQDDFNKMLFAKAATANISAPKNTTTLLLIVVFVVAVHTPAYGCGGGEYRDSDGTGGNVSQKKRLKGLDSN